MKQNTVRPFEGSSHFAKIPGENIERSTFERSAGCSTTFNENSVIPIFCDEVLPGDIYTMDVGALCRLVTPKFPFFDNLQLDMHFFYVPNRILWDHWKNFMGERKNPNDTTNYLVPTITLKDTDLVPDSLFDYFGLPVGNIKKGGSITINALPLRAYNLIWNEWFRDENLQNPATINTGDSGDLAGHYHLLARNKKKDYFTSALPWPQKGDQATLPLSLHASISRIDYNWLQSSVTSGVDGSYHIAWADGGGPNSYLITVPAARPADNRKEFLLNKDAFHVNLDNPNPISINDLRQAITIQRFLELNARGGTRYVELLLSHFGVVSSDARIQRPEFIGEAHFQMNVNPVVQQSATNDVSPQGNLSAFALAGGGQHVFNKSFEEHGYILGFVSIRSDLTYQQGLNRMWSRKELFDFAFPQFAHLGEQTILNQEIYCTGDKSQDEGVWAYQERYAEYRYKQSLITGRLRSTAPQSLDNWHLAQHFSKLPALNSDFVREQIPVGRVVAIPSQPHFMLNAWFKMTTSRPLPVYSIPGLDVI